MYVILSHSISRFCRITWPIPIHKIGKIADDENWSVSMICFVEGCSLECDWWELIIGLINGPVQNRKQTII